MSTTSEQRLAQAAATARRWRLTLEAMDGSDASAEQLCIVHRCWEAAEHAVVLLRDGWPPPPSSQRS